MSQTHTFPETDNHHQTAVIDLVEDDQQSAATFYDSSSPLLAPPNQIDKTRRNSRKRKFILCCLIFVLLAGGGLALHQLLKINRVNVKVQTDTRHDAQEAKARGDSKSSENNLSTEAVNLTRQALGSDSLTPGNTSTPGATPMVAQPNSTGSATLALQNLSGTVNPPATREGESTNAKTGSESDNGATRDQPSRANNSPAQELAQSRANTTQTIYVDDSPPKTPAAVATSRPPSRVDTKSATKPLVSPAVLPPFGTMLPVRTQGVIFTLRNNSYARLELTREVKGEGWSLPKGTTLIGRASGSEYDRAFIAVIGYLDSRDNKLVKMSGEVLGSDGGSGIQGKRVVVDSGGLKRTLSKIASSGVQAAGMLASGFGGQRTVIVDGAGGRIVNPLTDEASRAVGAANGYKRTFVKVEAGHPAYVMVAELPKDRPAIDAPGDDELVHSAGSLTERELMELLLFGTSEEISAAIPLMTDEQKTVALRTVSTGNEKK